MYGDMNLFISTPSNDSCEVGSQRCYIPTNIPLICLKLTFNFVIGQQTYILLKLAVLRLHANCLMKFLKEMLYLGIL
jgi:hypothetical protein